MNVGRTFFGHLGPAAVPAAWLLGGLLLCGATLAVVSAPRTELSERALLAAADGVRAALAIYHADSARNGAPRWPASLADLPADAVPVDPWTGRKDWGTVRDAQGGITGIYSRSGRSIPDSAWLRAYAVRRAPKAPGQDGDGDISNWVFSADAAAPVSGSAGRATGLLSAMAALEGRWPGQSATDVLRDRAVLTALPLAVAPRPSLERAPLPVPAADRSTATPVAVKAPVRQSTPAPLALLQVAPAVPDSELSETPQEPQPPAPGEEAFSEDPLESACQMEIAIDADIACRTEKGFAPVDHGQMYDRCVRDYELRMSRCIAEKAKG